MAYAMFISLASRTNTFSSVFLVVAFALATAAIASPFRQPDIDYDHGIERAKNTFPEDLRLTDAIYSDYTLLPDIGSGGKAAWSCGRHLFNATAEPKKLPLEEFGEWRRKAPEFKERNALYSYLLFSNWGGAGNKGISQSLLEEVFEQALTGQAYIITIAAEEELTEKPNKIIGLAFFPDHKLASYTNCYLGLGFSLYPQSDSPNLKHAQNGFQNFRFDENISLLES